MGTAGGGGGWRRRVERAGETRKRRRESTRRRFREDGRPSVVVVARLELAAGGREFAIGPGEAVMVPVMAPHHVRNESASSISLSITWRSDWSFAEADARCWNGLLRKAGLSPRAPRRWPHSNRAKALAFRAWWRVTRAS